MNRVAFIVVLMLLFSSAAYGADNGALVLESSSGKIAKGQEFTVVMSIDNLNEVYALSVELAFDPEYALPEESTFHLGTDLRDKEHFIAKNIVEDSGKAILTFTLLGNESPLRASSPIGSINLRAKKLGTTAIRINKSLLLRSDGSVINSSLGNIDIKISSTSTRDNSSHESNNSQETETLALPSNFFLSNLDGSPINESSLAIYGDTSISGISNIFTIKGDDKLAHELILSIKVGDEFLDKNLGIYYFNGDRVKWIYLGGTIENGYITTVIDRFGQFQAMENVNYKSFDDIENSWANEDIERLTIMGIVNGVDENSFSPKALVTRAQVSKILALTLDLHGSQVASPFSDRQLIPDWASKYVNTLSSIGIINGYGDNSFRPNENITRLQLALMVNRVLNGNFTTQDIVPFTDEEFIPDWAKDSVYAVRSAGILEGYGDGTFKPNNPITREELCRVMIKLLKLQGVL